MREIAYILLIMLVATIPVNVAACNRESFNELRETASLMRLHYEFNQDNSRFNVSIRNFHRYFYYIIGDETFFPPANMVTGLADVNLGQFDQGAIIDIEILAYNDFNCSQSVSRLYRRLPFFNQFANHELCNDLEDCEFCDQLTTQRLSEDVFLMGVNMCIEDQAEAEQEVPEEEPENNTFIYMMYGAIILTTVIILGVIVLIRKRLRLKRESAL